MPRDALPKRWKVVRLGEVGQIVTGKTPSTSHSEYFGGEIPFVTPSDMDGRKTISRTERFLTELGAQSVKSARIPASTVMVSCIGSDLGKVAIAGSDCITNQQINSIIPKADFVGDFVYYALLPRKSELQSLAGGGSAQPIINKGHFSQLPIVTPPIEEQRTIANVLRALDDKIELNRRANETLEGTACAIFKSWFVNFDPVHAKAEGRQPFGMDAETAALFPGSFEDSSLGKIPKGFHIAELGSLLAELETGSRPKGGVGGFVDGIPSVGAESIVGLAKFDFGKTKYVPHDFYSKMTKGRIKSRDVLIYKDGGRPGEYEPHVALFGDGFPFDTACINEHVYRLQARQPLSQAYLYFWLTSDLALDEMRQKGTGVAIPGLNSTAVRSLATLLPSEGVLRRYEDVCEPMIRAILNNAKESCTLTSIRDALLPKLVSGEIRVKDAEKMVGEKV